MTETNTPAPTSLAAVTSTAQKTVASTHPVAIQHAVKAQTLVSGWAARAIDNGIATAHLIAFRMNNETWNEMLQLQEAVRLRVQQQQDWLQGWAAWAEEWAQIKGANTMSKLVEQEFNLVAQLGRLLSDQATDLVGLQENIEVDYA